MANDPVIRGIKLGRNPRPPTTVNKEVALLKAMLNRAIAWGLLDTNPILRVKKLPEPEGRVRYLAPEEIERLLAACPPHLRPIVVCALHTGMRRGEILGLTCGDRQGTHTPRRHPPT
jgi:integrase